MTALMPGMQVRARGLTWSLVEVAPAGDVQRLRLRCDEGPMRGQEFDLLSPPDAVEPITAEFDVTTPGRLTDWLLYHRAFLQRPRLEGGSQGHFARRNELSPRVLPGTRGDPGGR